MAALFWKLHYSTAQTKLLILSILSLAAAVAASLRWPSIWTVTHYLFDYEFGFMKRSLFGAIIGLFLEPPFYFLDLAIIAHIIYMACLVLIIYIAFYYALKSGDYFFTLLLFTSTAFTYLGHLVGYFDHLGWIIIVLSILLPITWIGVVARIVMCIFGCLVHEVFVFFFAPFIAADLWLRRYLRNQDPWLPSLAVTAGTVFTIVFVLQVEPPAHFAVTFEHLDSKSADFSPRSDSVEVLFRNVSENMTKMGWARIQIEIWIQLAGAIVSTLPLVMYFTILNILSVKRAKPSMIATMIIIGVPIGTLSANIIAWDTFRFGAVAQLTTILLFFSISMRLDEPVTHQGALKGYEWIAAFMVFLSLSTQPMLFDGIRLERFPYVSHVQHAWDAATKSDHDWVVIPEK